MFIEMRKKSFHYHFMTSPYDNTTPMKMKDVEEDVRYAVRGTHPNHPQKYTNFHSLLYLPPIAEDGITTSSSSSRNDGMSLVDRCHPTTPHSKASWDRGCGVVSCTMVLCGHIIIDTTPYYCCCCWCIIRISIIAGISNFIVLCHFSHRTRTTSDHCDHHNVTPPPIVHRRWWSWWYDDDHDDLVFMSLEYHYYYYYYYYYYYIIIFIIIIFTTPSRSNGIQGHTIVSCLCHCATTILLLLLLYIILIIESSSSSSSHYTLL